MTDTFTDAEIDGLAAKTVAHVVHYGKREFVVLPSEAYGVLKRIRSLVKDGTTDLVPLVHRDGFVWLVVGPHVPISVDEIESDEGKTAKHTLKRLGLEFLTYPGSPQISPPPRRQFPRIRWLHRVRWLAGPHDAGGSLGAPACAVSGVAWSRVAPEIRVVDAVERLHIHPGERIEAVAQ